MTECRCTRKLTLTVVGFSVVLIIALTLGLVLGLGNNKNKETSTRTFTIDHAANTFLKDGVPFRYVAGAIHSFRVLPEAWSKRLRTMRAAGLNVIDTYAEWALHNPHDGVYKWDGIADIVSFIKMAQAEDLLVIFRPGPFICAERDNGGFPHWLTTKYPNIKLRTSDANYLSEVRKWYAELMPRLEPYFYGNGGPIIMVAVENEYGVYEACDHNYLNWLRDETQKYTKDQALLFTVDIPNERMACGKIDGVFATTNFGFDAVQQADEYWQLLRALQPTGPLVNSEFYVGWFAHWQHDNQRRDGKLAAAALRTLLTQSASVNIYMFFGGTSFGFTAGANSNGYGEYSSIITSYDFDAPMNEIGSVTPKYELMRNVIKEFLEVPDIQLNPAKCLAYGQVKLQPVLELLSAQGRNLLAKGKAVQSKQPQSFEQLDQYSGLVLYETILPKFEIDPTLLRVTDLRDRCFVFIDQQYVGTLSRENRIDALPLHKGWGSNLQLLVENQGRNDYDITNNTKGIFGAVTIQKFSGEVQILSNWNSTSFPLENDSIEKLLQQLQPAELEVQTVLRTGPLFFKGTLNIVGEIGDTFLNVRGWGKGVVWLNGFNLGRYWPLAGPQLTLYIPNELLRQGENTLLLLEYQLANKELTVELVSEAQLDNNGGEV